MLLNNIPGGDTGSKNPSTQNISDTAEGWSWNYGSRTLTLNGLILETNDMSGICLPPYSTIILAPGSSNRVAIVDRPNDSQGYGVAVIEDDTLPRCDLTVQGSGVLSITGDSSMSDGFIAVYVPRGTFNMESGTIYAKVGGAISDCTLVADSLDPNVVAYQKSAGGDYNLATTWVESNLTFFYNNGNNKTTDIKLVNGTLPTSSATVSNLTLSGKVGTPLSGTDVIITLTGCTFEELSTEENVSGWFSGLPTGISVSVSAVDGNTAMLAFSGTPKAASSAVMSITIPGGKLSTGENLTVAPNSEARFGIVQLMPRTTALNLWNSGTISYQAGSGTASANPTTSNITNTAEGWTWYRYANSDYADYTLVLDGINLASGSDIAIQLPAGSTIVLTDGSNNTVISDGSKSNCHGIYGAGALTVKGGGTLTVTGGNESGFSCGLYAGGDMTILSGTIIATGRGTGMYSRGLHTSGTLCIENATVTARGGDNVQYSYGAFAAGDIRLSEAQVTLTGGRGSVGSYGMMASPGSIMFSGGITYASASDSSPAVYAMILGASGRTIEAPFMAVFQKSGENYTVATQLSGDGRYYVCPGSNNAIASDLRIAPAPLGFPGSGTEAEPYQISTAAQLKEMSDRVNGQNALFAGKHYELTANIVLNANIENDPAQWSPIGAGASTAFTGVFDGNGHTIRGLYIHSDRDYVGLFGYTQEATVRNVGLVGGQIASDSSYCFAGGLVGFNFLGTIEDCYNTGSVSGHVAGGIVGLNVGGHIQDSYNTGAIAASGNGCAAGGIAGENQNADLTIVNCYNTGSVSASVWEEDDEGYVGGIAGVNDESSIKNCYSAGALSGPSGGEAYIYMGGIAGSSTLNVESTIENAYWVDTYAGVGVNDDEQDGCISKTPAEMKEAAFVALLNTNVEALEDTYPTISPWRAAAADENGGYPLLGTVAPTFTLTISGGGSGATASGSYAAGTAVPISAGTRDGYTFNGWTTNNGGSFANTAAANTTFTMPDGNVTVTAGWVLNNNGGGSVPASGDTGGSASTSVMVNGKAVSAGTSQTKTDADGKKVTTVTIDSGRLETILTAQSTGATVTIPITNNADRAVGTLTGQMVKSMENKDATLVIQTGSSSYTLPASEINIDSISKQLGANVALADVTVSVSVSSPSNAMAQVVKNAEKEGGFTLVAPAVDFTITCTYGDKTVPVSLFNAYVERMIAIPDGVNPNKITTGVVVEPDGTVHHVPTRVTVIEGRYYAVINSLTNSTYSVVWNPVEFKDVANHWAKDAVNNMGSRMVVTGVGNGNYNPDKAITRAEFAAIVVRALGLEPETGSSAFSDVAASEWYAGYIKTAAAYGIITGYNEKVFGPNDTITREQAMTMVARAMKITGLNANLTGSDVNTLIGAYADGTTVSDYANAGVAACLKTEVVSGREGKTLAPLGKVTRAETAVMIERLLSHSNLI